MTGPDPELKVQQEIVETPSNTQEVARSIGAYRILEKVHAGYSGTIFRASRREDGREFALKLLKQEFTRDQEAMKRFLHEAGALSNLRHPNIVSICDSGITQKGGAPYIVTEWINGENLEELIKREKLPAERAVAIARSISQGLGAANRIGIFHRDLSPGNVIIGNDGVARVLDFGIAQVSPVAQRITRTGAVVGTSEYMSPEQCLGYAADARTDVYGLGCLLYTMLTGKSPFACDNVGHSMAMHVGNARSFVKEGLREVNCPASLEAIILTMLSRDADKRQQTMAEVDNALASFEKGIPVVAPVRVGKNVYRAAFAIAAVLILIPIVYTGSQNVAAWMRAGERMQVPAQTPGAKLLGQRHFHEDLDRNSAMTFEPRRRHRHRMYESLPDNFHPGFLYLRSIEQKVLVHFHAQPVPGLELAPSTPTTLRLRVGVDGALKEVNVYKSSGKKWLDDYAVSVVNAAAPFDPIDTDEIRKHEKDDPSTLPSLRPSDAATREADEQLRAFLRGDRLYGTSEQTKSALIETTLPPLGNNWTRLISID